MQLSSCGGKVSGVPRYDPRVHKPCEANGCMNIEKLWRFPEWQPAVSKMICGECRAFAQGCIKRHWSVDFLLTDGDRAEIAAYEMRSEMPEEITPEDIANTMPPKSWEA